jgi:hypothetical protein
MVPFLSVTDGQPTLVLALIPLLLISITLEVWQDSKRSIQDQTENEMKAQVLDPES